MKKLYLCRGENFVNGIQIGFCGQVKTLDNWIIAIFGDSEKIKNFFKDDTDKEIIEYIKKNAGKRLEVFRG